MAQNVEVRRFGHFRLAGYVSGRVIVALRRVCVNVARLRRSGFVWALYPSPDGLGYACDTPPAFQIPGAEPPRPTYREIRPRKDSAEGGGGRRIELEAISGRVMATKGTQKWRVTSG